MAARRKSKAPETAWRKEPEPLPPDPSASDKELALVALEKRKLGDRPSSREAAALKRVEAAREAQLRWSLLRSVPQRDYRAMAGGLSTRQLHLQADTHGLPIGGPTVDMEQLVYALHRFLAANREALKGNAHEQIDEHEREMRRMRREAMQLDLEERRRSVVHRETLAEGFERISAVLHRLGDRLQRRYGEDALQLFEDSLDEAERVLDELIGTRKRNK